MSARRILVVEEGEESQLRTAAERNMEIGDECRVGREAELPVALDPLDRRVSRTAIVITCTTDGWLINSLNRNGVVVQPWAQPASLAQPVELLSSARVALRVLGTRQRLHWVLLEDDSRLGRDCAAPPGTVGTDLEVPVRPLTQPQREVLGLLFANLLAWPPVVGAEPLQLKQVARRLGLSVSAVQARLHDVRLKAEHLGLGRQVPLHDPEYLYVLARAGYVRPDEQLVQRA